MWEGGSFESGMPLEKAVADGTVKTIERAFKRKVSLTYWKQGTKAAVELCGVEWLCVVASELDTFHSVRRPAPLLDPCVLLGRIADG